MTARSRGQLDGRPRAAHARDAAGQADAVIWHELECGSYDADLALWLELARRARGPVLDIGAGAGRVARVLARAGYAVTAVERDGELHAALLDRAEGLAVECVRADARAFALARRDFRLCIVPMHTIQLFGGAARRAAFLRCARAHLRPRGLLAVAVLPDAEPFDRARGHPCPAPESMRVGRLRYVSAPTRVAVGARSILIERERTILATGDRPERVIARVRDRIELVRLSAAEVAGELADAGFSCTQTRRIAATDEHVASEVVIAVV